MKRLLLILIIIMCASVNSQEKDSIIYIPYGQPSGVDSIKLEIVKYLIDNKELKPTDNLLKLYDSKIFTTELIDNGVLELKKKGVFRIVTSTSHSHRYLLLVNNDITILNYNDLSKTLEYVLGFLKKNNESNENIAKYIQIIINEYKMEQNRIKT